ncbi:MAG: hypothetical protein SWK76_13115 [Actinomycetota bacterium]|nr:hypothetical protein [Actinomycetota bacterium]
MNNKNLKNILQLIGSRRTLIALLCLGLLPVLLLYGCGGKIIPSEEAKEMILEAEEALRGIHSAHIEMTTSLDDGETGDRRNQSWTTDVNEEDYHYSVTYSVPDSEAKEIYIEVTYVDGRKYVRTSRDDEWMETTDVDEDSEEIDAQMAISALFALPQDFEHAEILDGGDEDHTGAIHLRLFLGQGDMPGLFEEDEEFNPTDSPGGQSDIWLEEDTHYPIRYELIAYGCFAPLDIWHCDLRYSVSISEINEAITISAPI